jgi:hypothetical protein
MTEEKTTIDKIEAISGRIVSKIANILRWILVLSPIAATGFIWVYGFLVVIGINVFAVSEWTVFGVEPLFLLSETNKPYIQIVWASISISTFPALLVAAKLLKKDYTPLRAIDSRSGKTGVWKLPSERFESMTVLDYNDNEIGREGLHKIDFSNGKIGYEADEYDAKTNTAVTSWYVGLAPEDVQYPRRICQTGQFRSRHCRGQEPSGPRSWCRRSQRSNPSTRTSATIRQNASDSA